MGRITFVLAAVCLPFAAFGGEPLGPAVQIVSPAPGVCLDNDGAVSQGIPCGEAFDEGRSIPLALNLSQFGGTPLRIIFRTAWVENVSELRCENGECEEVLVPQNRAEEWSVRFRFPDGENDVLADNYDIPGFLVGDSPDTTLTVMVQNDWLPLPEPGDARSEQERCADFPDVCAIDTVSFPLDRKPPSIVMCEFQRGAEALDGVAGVPWDQVEGQCFADAVPDVAFAVLDNQTPADQLNPVINQVIEGCRVTHVITATDTCGAGNTQELSFDTYRPARADQVTVGLDLYRCDLEGCPERIGDIVIDENGDEVNALADNARIDRATLMFNVAAEAGCESEFEAVLMRADNVVDECPAFEDLVPDESGQVNNPCAVVVPGQVIDEPGSYVARIRIGSCGVTVAEATKDFTIIERPVADAGGPYEAPQGAALMLDASDSTAPPEINGIVEYAWDLDGNRFFSEDEISAEPTIAFDTTQGDGAYEVRLRITAGNGATEEDVAQITVTDVSPNCDAGGPYEISEGGELRFDGSASAPGHPTEPITNFDWDFGDDRRPQSGNGLTNPVHIYRESRAEPFTVRLQVRDVDSAMECTTQVTVLDVDPIIDGAGAINPEALREGEPVTFTAGQTRPGAASDPITDYSWTFEDGGVPANGAALRRPVNTYNDIAPGDTGGETRNVCLTVTDSDQSTASACFEIFVADLQPRAFFDGPENSRQGVVVNFDADSTAAGGAADPLQRLEWDFDSDGVVDLETGPEQRVVSHRFDNNGEYTVTLTVHDEDSSATFQRIINIEDAQPLAAVEPVFNDGLEFVFEGDELFLDASGSRAGSDTDPIIRYQWDFGDGETEITEQPSTRHRWADDGTYRISMTAIDLDGSRSTAIVIVDVVNQDPVVEIVTRDLAVEVGETIQFVVASGEVPPGQGARVVALVSDVAGDLPPDPVTWDMGIGDDGIFEQAEPQFAFNEVGVQTVTVTVADGDGGTATAEVNIEVTEEAARISDLDPQTVAEGDTLRFSLSVNSPDLGDNAGRVDVDLLERPEGAEVTIVEDAENLRIDFDWTPTYYDAGQHRFRVRARSGETQRLRTVEIEVIEAGTPKLVATGGGSGRGTVNLYTYQPSGNGIGLQATGEVEVGLGTGGLAVESTGHRAWVTVPGSNKVAVVATEGRGQVLRRVPTGRTPLAVVEGGDFMWVLNASDGSLTIIDRFSLKVDFTVDLGLAYPTDAVWLPAGFDDLPSARLAVVTRRSGHIVLIDPEAARAGADPIVQRYQLGGVLSRVVADASTGTLYAADGKNRRIYSVQASALAAGDADETTYDLDFAARDIIAEAGRLYAATGNALVWFEGEETDTNRFISALGLGVVPEAILSGGAIAVVTENRVENYSRDGVTRIVDAEGNRVRRVYTFVSPE